MCFIRGKYIVLFICVFSVLVTMSVYVQAGGLLPESFTKKISLQPAITKIIEDDDLQRAVQKLNALHGEMAMEGWVLFSVIEYIDDEDFEGFFVTYVKSKSINE